jgi:hypothetical protein
MFSTGLQTGFALGTWPGTQGTSAQASPQASTAATAGFGTTASGADTGGRDPVTTSVLVVGTAALVGLVLIYVSLPR